MDFTRVLVTGGAGMVARALPFGIKCTREDLDVRDAAQALRVVKAKKPSAILHLAALDVNRSEASPLEANATHILGTYHMALAARAAKIPMIFVSSGAIFDGKKGQAFDEDASPSPANVYGQGKWAAEILIREMLKDYLIARGGWIFGGEQAHHQKFVELAIRKARAGEPIDAAEDQWGSPTWSKDFVAELMRLMKGGKRGLFHLVNAGAATPADIADEIVASLKSKSQVRRLERAALRPGGPRRAESETLVSKTIKLRPWREALRAYVTGGD